MRRLFDRLVLRLQSLVRPHTLDRSLRSEIEVHLEEEIDDLVAKGMTPSAARTAALRAFGPRTAIEDACRDTRRVAVIEQLVQDLRSALRALARQPMLVAASTLTIAIAVAANTTVVGVAAELLLSKPSAANPDALFNMFLGGGSHTSYSRWRDLDESGALAGIAGYSIESTVTWRGPERSENVGAMIVTPNFFDVLGVPVAHGRGFTTREARPELEPAIAVVSHRFWRDRLAQDPQVVGRTIVVNARPYTVIGVLPERLRSMPGLGLSPEVYLPISRSLVPDLHEPRAAHVLLVGRLAAGQSMQQGRAALAAVAERLAVSYNDKRFASKPAFIPVGSAALLLPDASKVNAFVALLVVAVSLVLAIACANVAGLLLARAATRRHEIAVRVALGANRRRLVQQFVAEGFWLALAGTMGGLALMTVFDRLLARVTLPFPLQVTLGAPLDARMLGYAVVLTVAATLLSALAPALQATRRSQLSALKHDGSAIVHRRWTLRRLLVVGQMAIAVVLLVASAIFLRNVAWAEAIDPGFEPMQTLLAEISFVQGRYTRGTSQALLETAVERVRTMPSVQSASYAWAAPLVAGGRAMGVRMTIDAVGDVQVAYETNFVGPGFFRTLLIPVVRGREFTADDRPSTTGVAVVNEEFVRRYLKDIEPIGRVLHMPAEKTTYPVQIVGVVGNITHRAPGEAPRAAIYEPYAQRAGAHSIVHLFVHTTGESRSLAIDIRQTLEQLDASASVRVRQLWQALAPAFLPNRVAAGVLGTLGSIGLLLALLGLFAVVCYTVSRRTAEIGVRMALGATRRAVMNLVLREAVVLSMIGVVLGLTAAWFAAAPLSMFLVPGLSPRDPLSFSVTAMLIMAVSVAAAWAPARRATKIDPVTSLRSE
jgi:putative ABC transport system permease protein